MAVEKKLVLSWPTGTGGDMVRSCLYPLIFDGDWKWHQSILYWNGSMVSHVNDNTGAANIEMKYYYSIHMFHHSETDIECITSIINYAKDNNLNPAVTFICIKDNKFIDIAMENNTLKRINIHPINANKWTTKFKWITEFRKEHPDKINRNFIVLGNKIHMMYMDNFYQWETMKQELENYLEFYNITGFKENFPIVKQFWQAWIDEQRFKME